jgi:hypothetical protein
MIVRDLSVDDLMLDDLARVLAVRVHRVPALAHGAERSLRVLIFDWIVVGALHGHGALARMLVWPAAVLGVNDHAHLWSTALA